MGVTIKVKFPNGEIKSFEAKEGEVLQEVLRRNGIVPDSVVILRNGTPIPYTEKIRKDDEILAIIAFSGGRLLLQAN